MFTDDEIKDAFEILDRGGKKVINFEDLKEFMD